MITEPIVKIVQVIVKHVKLQMTVLPVVQIFILDMLITIKEFVLTVMTKQILTMVE